MFPNQKVHLVEQIYAPLFKSFIDLLIAFWPVWLFLILGYICEQLWLFWKQENFKHNIEWTFFEIKLPRQTLRTPKAMEQILLSMHHLKNAPGNFVEKYFDGEVGRWYSLEMSSFGGEIHLYLKVPTKLKGVVQSNFYAQYPDIEIIEIKDYLHHYLPENLEDIQSQGLEFFGAELKLNKEDVYPIRTYEDFPTQSAEEETLDPISSLIEVLSKINRQDKVFIQILARPINENMEEEAEHIIKKIKAKGKVSETHMTKDGPVTISRDRPLSTYEQEELEELQRAISKSYFESFIRFIYISPKTLFNMDFARRGIRAAYNQYASEAMNSFGTFEKTQTRINWYSWPIVLQEKRLEWRKRRILHMFYEREFPEEHLAGRILKARPLNFYFSSKAYLLNTAELATIYHPPTKMVLVGPAIKLAPAKKMGPPAGLPIFEEDSSRE